jgi:IS30 family transposase
MLSHLQMSFSHSQITGDLISDNHIETAQNDTIYAIIYHIQRNLTNKQQMA